MANKKPGARQPLSRARPRAVSKRGLSAVLTKSPSAAKKRSVTGPARNVVRRKRRPPADPATVYQRLSEEYPRAQCALVHESPYQLIVATILSAQCTDARVNLVTPNLFAIYPRASDLADADQSELEKVIQSTGFFRNKSKSLIGMASAVVEEHQGEIPDTMEKLFQLPGVGRKTANVVLGNAFGINEGVVVDTHVGRLSARLGFSRHSDPVKIEQDLICLFPREKWTMLAHLLISHGRAICVARRPRCEECVLSDICPSSLV
ncbi:MAG: endonuclease III [Gemmatimonadota bacterium]|nr:endonuclease III [Gemmatimonadota bacterium]